MTTNIHNLEPAGNEYSAPVELSEAKGDERALQQLQELGIEDVDQALSAFQEDEHAFNDRLKSAILHGVLTFPLIVLSWYIIGWLKSYVSFIGFAHWIVIVSWLSYLGKGLWITDKQQQIASVLQHFNDPRSVGPLLEWYVHLDDDEELDDHRTAAAQRIQELLGQVVSAQESGLTAERLEWLAQSITKDDLAWSLAVIQALGKFGAQEHVKGVKQVLKWPGDTPAYSEVRQAADQAIELISARTEQEKLRTSLLRPAESAGEAALLRPATHTESDVSSLLRASSQQEEA